MEDAGLRVGKLNGVETVSDIPLRTSSVLSCCPDWLIDSTANRPLVTGLEPTLESHAWA